MENFFAEVPPITKLLLSHQLIGFAIQGGEYISRYDLYFNFEKIFHEGEVMYSINKADEFYIDLEINHVSLLLEAFKHVCPVLNRYFVSQYLV